MTTLHLRLAALFLTLYSPVAAQPAVQIAYESTRDRFHYRFENPSNFDTEDLVPHEFVQTFWADNHWVVVRAAFGVAKRTLDFEVAATPQRTARADDFDTFYQPSGDVAVSGTTSNASLRSLRFRQSISLGRAGGLAWHVGYQYRRDRNKFHPGLKIVTHTLPPSWEATAIVINETTISNVHEVIFGAARQWSLNQRWRVDLNLDLAPTTNARSTTILPDKYPGREILFNAIVATVSPAIKLTRTAGWPISLSVGGTRTFSYLGARRYERATLTAGISLGLGR